MNLFLDDERKVSDVKWMTLPIGQWAIVRNYDEFVKYITENGLPSFISFDHDLAPEHYPWSEVTEPYYRLGQLPYDSYKIPTGKACAEWLVEYCRERDLSTPDYDCHTRNPIGARHIRIALGFYENEYCRKHGIADIDRDANKGYGKKD